LSEGWTDDLTSLVVMALKREKSSNSY